jgi:hypothetical protein
MIKSRKRRLVTRRRGRAPSADVSLVAVRLLQLLADRAGHPCPDNDVLAHALGVNTRVVRDALALLEKRREIEIQRTASIGGLRRRMRVKIGRRWREWTDHSKRGAYDLRITSPDLRVLAGIHGCAHHLLRVLSAGRFE